MSAHLRVVVQLEDFRNKDIFVLAHDRHSHHQLQQVQNFFRIIGFRCDKYKAMENFIQRLHEVNDVINRLQKQKIKHAESE